MSKSKNKDVIISTLFRDVTVNTRVSSLDSRKYWEDRPGELLSFVQTHVTLGLFKEVHLYL